jgi:hypothetical protein
VSKGAKLETDQTPEAVRTDFSRDGFEVLSANGEFAVYVFVSTGADDDRDRGDPHQTFEARVKNITNRELVN